jgi:hypothetical protein
VGQVVTEKHSVGGVDAPCMAIDEEIACHAYPSVTSIWWDIVFGLGGGIWRFNVQSFGGSGIAPVAL